MEVEQAKGKRSCLQIFIILLTLIGLALAYFLSIKNPHSITFSISENVYPALEKIEAAKAQINPHKLDMEIRIRIEETLLKALTELSTEDPAFFNINWHEGGRVKDFYEELLYRIAYFIHENGLGISKPGNKSYEPRFAEKE